MSRIKGTGMLQVVKALRSLRGAALTALPEHLRHYLDERISTTEMYPDADWLELTRALVKLMPPDTPEVWEMLGRVSADHDFSSVYRGMVLRRASLPEALAGLRNVFHFYVDTGRLEVLADDARGQVEMHEYALVSDEFCRFVRGFASEYLK